MTKGQNDVGAANNPPFLCRSISNRTRVHDVFPAQAMLTKCRCHKRKRTTPRRDVDILLTGVRKARILITLDNDNESIPDGPSSSGHVKGGALVPAPENTTLWEDFVANLSNPDPQARIDAIQAIVRAPRDADNTDMVVRTIRELFDDEAARVRCVAIRTVGEMGGGSEAVSNMRCLIRLFRDEARYIRLTAAKAIAALGSNLGVRTVLAEIIPLLQSSEAPVRAGATHVIANLGVPAGTDSVIALLGNLMADENGEVRHAAVMAVGRIGYKAATDTVVKNLSPLLQDPDEVVQHDAACAIGRLGKASATEANLSRLLGLRDSGCGGDQWIAGVWAFRALGLDALSQPLLGQLAEMLQDRNICVHNYARRILETFSHSARSRARRGRAIADPQRREHSNYGVPVETRIRWLENVILTEEERK